MVLISYSEQPKETVSNVEGACTGIKLKGTENRTVVSFLAKLLLPPQSRSVNPPKTNLSTLTRVTVGPQ